MTHPIPFTGSPLNRRSIERRDANWVRTQLENPNSRFLPLWRLQLLVKNGEVRTPGWARRELLAEIPSATEPVFLGTAEEIPHFAVDISGLSDPLETLELQGVASFEDLRGVGASLSPEDASICAQARSLVDWHDRNAYCSGCGELTRAAQGGTLRYCGSCDREHFPRTDPVAISVVISGDDCLLGRSSSWPGNMYSALAGFVEPGESLEEAARREILEEVNIRVGRVRYLESQPWPFPSSLMVGCIAEAETREIRIDPHELADARWFGRTTLRAALAGETSELTVPPPVAIAHRLIRAWVEER
ncbi:MAG: NAD(+) diphosphatase [Myxococcota bacterium]